MRATTRDREQFIASLLKQVPTATLADARKLLRWGATYGRLAEAECNGDWPADNGERETVACSKCEAHYAPSACTIRRNREESTQDVECPSCRAERIIREVCEGMGGRCDPGIGPKDLCTPHFQGDPRGYTVRLQIAGAPLDAYDRPALAIPTS